MEEKLSGFPLAKGATQALNSEMDEEAKQNQPILKNILGGWETAKGVGMCFVLSLAAGWLSRELVSGKIDSANKAAAYILDLALLVMISVLAILGAKRWRNDRLTPAAKRILIISSVFLIVFFVVGWKSDLSLK